MKRAGLGIMGGGAIAFVLWFPGFLADMRQVLQEPLVSGIDAHFGNQSPDQVASLANWEGGSWGRYGFYLAPGHEGRVRLQLPGNGPGIVKLKIGAYDPGLIVVRVEEIGETQAISSSALYGDIVNVPVSGPTHLMISASNLGRADQLIVERITAAWFPIGPGLPAAWPMALSLAFVLIGLCWLIAPLGNQSSGLFMSKNRRVFIWFGCAGLYLALVVGMDLRWSQFDLARGLPLPPDVQMTWWPFARKFQWFSEAAGFYSGAFREREPLYIAALHQWLLLWGDTGPAVRLFSLCLSGLLIPIVGAFIWGLTGRWWIGVLGGWIVSLSPEWIGLATMGLRDEATVLLLLGFLSVWSWTRGWVGAGMLGLSMGLLWLARPPLLSVTLPLIWGVWLINEWRSRTGRSLLLPSHWPWLHLAMASVLAAALYLPYLQGMAQVHGDISWSTSWQARWNANVEFPNRLGTPGWPTVEEFERNPYAGPPITFGQYVFGLHSVPTVIFGQFKGWVQSTVYMALSPTPGLKHLVRIVVASGVDADLRHLSFKTVLVSGVLGIGFLFGWIGLWRVSQYQWVPLLALWGTWYAAFMYGLRLIEPFRQTAYVYPLILFCQLWGGWWLLSRLRLLPHAMQMDRETIVPKC